MLRMTSCERILRQAAQQPKHTDNEEDLDSKLSARVVPFFHGLGTVLATPGGLHGASQTRAFDFTTYRGLLSLDTNCCAVPNAY